MHNLQEASSPGKQRKRKKSGEGSGRRGSPEQLC